MQKAKISWILPGVALLIIGGIAVSTMFMPARGTPEDMANILEAREKANKASDKAATGDARKPEDNKQLAEGVAQALGTASVPGAGAPKSNIGSRAKREPIILAQKPQDTVVAPNSGAPSNQWYRPGVPVPSDESKKMNPGH